MLPFSEYPMRYYEKFFTAHMVEIHHVVWIPLLAISARLSLKLANHLCIFIFDSLRLTNVILSVFLIMPSDIFLVTSPA